MFEIINKSHTKTFTLGEVQSLLPLIYRMTEDVSKSVKYLMGCLEALPNKKSERGVELETQINESIQKWQNKMERLGARPKGLWLADFDYGKGYFCWKFPEVKILYKHGYQDGFTGRILISSIDNEEMNENSHSPN